MHGTVLPPQQALLGPCASRPRVMNVPSLPPSAPTEITKRRSCCCDEIYSDVWRAEISTWLVLRCTNCGQCSGHRLAKGRCPHCGESFSREVEVVATVSSTDALQME